MLSAQMPAETFQRENELSDPIFLLGGGGHALSALEVILASDNLAPFGYVSPEESPHQKFSDLRHFESLPEEPKNLFINGIGISIGLRRRMKLAEEAEAMGHIPRTVVSKTAVLSSLIQVDPGALVQNLAVVQVGVHLGKHVSVGAGAVIEHGVTLGAGSFVGPNATICGSVSIGDEVLIGAAATILPNLEIGSGAIIAAGAVVTKNVHPGTTVAGVPARSNKME